MQQQKTVSVREYARSRNIDPSTVYKAVRESRLPLTPEKLVNIQVADNLFREKPGAKNGEWAKARAIHEGYKAKHAKLDYEKAIGKIIDIDVVEASMARCAELMVRDIEQFGSHAEEIMFISQAGDVQKVRKRIKELTDELRRTMAANLRIVNVGQA